MRRLPGLWVPRLPQVRHPHTPTHPHPHNCLGCLGSQSPEFINHFHNVSWFVFVFNNEFINWLVIDALFYEIIAVLVVTCTLTGVPDGDRRSWCGEEPWHWRCDSQSCLLHSSLLLLELVSALVGDRARVAPGWMAVPSLISLMRVMPALTLTPTLLGLMRVPPSPRAPGTFDCVE